MPHASDLYIDFISKRHSLRESVSLPAIDPLEERLVEIIASASESNKPLSVTELINMSELGSPTTLHQRLTMLRTKGWIELAYTNNARRRQLQLTPDGFRYFDKLAKCMISSIR